MKSLGTILFRKTFGQVCNKNKNEMALEDNKTSF